MENNSVPLEESKVVFRHIAFQAPKGDISAICLSYEKEESALSLFSAIHEYLDVPSQTPRNIMSVVFSKKSEQFYTMTLDFSVGDIYRHIFVDGIEKKYVNEIVQSLKTYKYYLIVAGYNASTGFTLLPIKINHLFRNSLIIDSKEVSGSKDCDFEWMRFFERFSPD